MNHSEAMYKLSELLGSLEREKDSTDSANIRETLVLHLADHLNDVKELCEVCTQSTSCSELLAHPCDLPRLYPRLVCPDCYQKTKKKMQPPTELDDTECGTGGSDHEGECPYEYEDDHDDYDEHISSGYSQADSIDLEPACPCGFGDCDGDCGTLPCGCIDVHKEWKHDMRRAFTVKY